LRALGRAEGVDAETKQFRKALGEEFDLPAQVTTLV
jgi:hypothetical protein